MPDAGGVHVVNNGAAALALVTCALAAGREIVVARGELVEIGDGFRIPELLESLGARLREVGTTNRVRLADYADAIGDDTAFVLKVHPSNFVVSGFTSSVAIADLASLPVPVVADIGSGLLADHPRLPDEPSAASALRAGADLVTASGDKLLGGPQCGLMLGRADLVESLRRHPFARALRVDKLTLAALEATLTGPTPPVATALATSRAELMLRAQVIAESLAPAVPASAVESDAAVGGGGAPGVSLDSAAVALPVDLAEPLRLDAEAPGRGTGRARPPAAGPDGGCRAGRPAPCGRRTPSRGTCRGQGVVHVVATAGHVDHGKSALVRALTGSDPDRLEEEHRRGLSIQLGYAWTSLPEVGDLAFVDVPGHERFISTMLAGVGPVPAVLFVVAADDPWMPQAAEHLAALDALCVQHAVVAVTRSDLADPAPAAARAEAELAQTSLQGSPVVQVSSRTGAGLDELRARLVELVQGLPAADSDADVRLWIDRRFTISGAGTVVTGTLPAGTVARGDTLSTGLGTVRVRGIESLEEKVDSMSGVARVALNLTGDVADLDVDANADDSRRLPLDRGPGRAGEQWRRRTAAHPADAACRRALGQRPLPAAGRPARTPDSRAPTPPPVRRPDAGAGPGEPAGLGSARPRPDAASAAPAWRSRRPRQGTGGRGRGAGPRLRGGAA